MATTDKTPIDRRVNFTIKSDGTLLANYQWKTFRFMFSDGSTVDVQAVNDDSDLRAAVLAHTGKAMIVGAARLTQVSAPADTPKRPMKRVASRSKTGMEPMSEKLPGI